MNCVICGKEIPEKRLKQGKTTCCRNCQLKTPESRQKRLEASKRSSEKLKALWTTEDFRNKYKQSIKTYWSKDSSHIEASKRAKLAYSNELARQNISKAIKLYYKSPENRRKTSIAVKAAMSTKEFKENFKIKINSIRTKEKQKKANKLIANSPEVKLKKYLTMKQNNSYGKSSWEENTYQLLLTKFNQDDIVRQYFDKERYSFNCDFYIKSLDLFVECHYGWHHNGHPFNETHQNDLDELALLQEKAKTSDNYKNKIYQWTDLDVRKRQCAKDNKLNWIVFYSWNDFKNWYDSISLKEAI